MKDKTFVEGMLVKPPHERAPDFVKCTGGFRRLAMIEFLQNQGGDYVNFDIKESKGGKWYAELDTFKPGDAQRPVVDEAPPQESGGGLVDDDLPF